MASVDPSINNFHMFKGFDTTYNDNSVNDNKNINNLPGWNGW